MHDFQGKVAVVTGAASGIGRALAARFAREGMRLALADIERDALDAAVSELREQGHDVMGAVTDVADAASVDALARATLDAYGKVHLLCNNAGVLPLASGPLWEASLNDWQWALGVNFWGAVHGVRSFMPILLGQDEPGHIVNTASMAGLIPGEGVYGVTKHAVVGLSEALYFELQRREAKVGASVLCPGFVRTRIATSERNRPTERQNDEAGSVEAHRAQSERLSARVAGGIEAERVAEAVVSGIRAERFYILTHTHLDDVVRRRMENILARDNPVARSG